MPEPQDCDLLRCLPLSGHQAGITSANLPGCLCRWRCLQAFSRYYSSTPFRLPYALIVAHAEAIGQACVKPKNHILVSISGMWPICNNRQVGDQPSIVLAFRLRYRAGSSLLAVPADTAMSWGAAANPRLGHASGRWFLAVPERCTLPSPKALRSVLASFPLIAIVSNQPRKSQNRHAILMRARCSAEAGSGVADSQELC